MAHKVIILYRLYMPYYFLGTFTEYPYLDTRPTPDLTFAHATYMPSTIPKGHNPHIPKMKPAMSRPRAFELCSIFFSFSSIINPHSFTAMHLNRCIADVKINLLPNPTRNNTAKKYFLTALFRISLLRN